MYQLQGLDKGEFLRHYWQQRPLLIRQGFIDFIDPIDADQLAGLAQEEEIDARIVTTNSDWQVHHGPFDEQDFTQLCQGKWSLLVQGVNQYLAQANALFQAIDFLPNWRKDDLMVSYSTAGAGVGAHIDQYDVFIVQGSGQRRWQVGLPGDFSELHQHLGLRQINDFSPCIDVQLNPGDVLYIPPNHPHKGETITPCLNYSIGFRAPTDNELLALVADQALAASAYPARYQDPHLALAADPAELDEIALQRLRQRLHQIIDSEQLPSLLARHFSQSQQLSMYDVQSLNARQVSQQLANGANVYFAPGVCPCYVNNGDQLVIYLDEEEFRVSSEEQAYLRPLFSPNAMPHTVQAIAERPALCALLSQWQSAGYLYIGSD